MLAALFSVVMFRVVIIGFLYRSTHQSNLASYAKLIGAGTAATVNFIIISLFELIYPRLVGEAAKNNGLF